jgi:hypothetical protein
LGEQEKTISVLLLFEKGNISSVNYNLLKFSFL